MFIDFTWPSVRVNTLFSPNTLVFGICSVGAVKRSSGPIRGEIFIDDALATPTYHKDEDSHEYMEYRFTGLHAGVKFRIFTAVRQENTSWHSNQYEARVSGSTRLPLVAPLWLQIFGRQYEANNIAIPVVATSSFFDVTLADYDPLSVDKCPSEAQPFATRAQTAWDRIGGDEEL